MAVTSLPRTEPVPVGSADVPGGRPGVRAVGLSKSYQSGKSEVLALDDVSLEAAAGEFVVLLGPSGCGKTTLLRCLAGLESPDEGTIEVAGASVYDRAARREVPPERRPLSMVFQSYALWPHMTTYDIVAYPLRSRGRRAEVAGSVQGLLDMVGIGHLARRYPAQMSGGQQQRVALARAIASGDPVVLFDEPLSNVDAKLRDQLRRQMKALQTQLGFTAVYVTHDQDEAMELATTLVVMRDGRVEQVGSPEDVYERPASPYVAQFVGSVNELEGTIVQRSSTTVAVETAIGSIDADGVDVPADVSSVLVVTRPERWTMNPDGADGVNSFSGVVESATYLGAKVEYEVRLGDDLLRTTGDWRQAHPVGSRLDLTIDPTSVRLFPR